MPATTQQLSVGSALHIRGQCKPCCDMNTARGCAKDTDCSFCHLPHTKKTRSRPCKSKRLQCKEFVNNVESLCKNDPERLANAMLHVPPQSSYAQGVLRQKLQQARGDELLPEKDASASS